MIRTYTDASPIPGCAHSDHAIRDGDMIINATTFELLLRLCCLTRITLSRRAGVGVKTIHRIGRGTALRASSAERIAAALVFPT